ncbi:MAG TPA: preprotein translocase subunit SecG [Candidatus Paceibacterota bacterium]
MSISAVLPYFQILLSVLLIGGILLQRSEASLGSAFGGSDLGGANFERRGAEKFIFRLTIIVGILFAISALAGLFLQ